MEWQPIETAPKDGTQILIWISAAWTRAQVRLVHWYDEWGNWQEGADPDPLTDEYCGIGSAVPTHWMPLPNPPVTP